MRVVFIFVTAIITAFAAIYINHRVQLVKEERFRAPLGELVEVNNHQMSIYTEGDGDKTLVFLSGGGTCSPILDFKSLFSTLSDEYKIVVVEKFGYGFSDVVNKKRDIDSILKDTRTALTKAGIEGPYVLCPHSMSGIEALYWAELYPQEIEAIIGLDMSVPQAYENYPINMPILKIVQLAAKVGLTRILPSVSESDAIKYGTLTDTEKKIYKAMFFKKTATVTMLNEVSCIKENAKIVGEKDTPQVPMLLFVSNGTGTGWSEAEWHERQEGFSERLKNGKIIHLDCPHYVHDHEFNRISAEMKVYLSMMPTSRK